MLDVPEWVQHTVFYQIFPDRFASSPNLDKPANLEKWESKPTLRGFKGGDLLGVVEKLDYLQDLGITGLYLNPIFMSTANHRYHTTDYFQIDPLLGGLSAFRTLLEEAHKREMKIVLDGVFNHTGRGFFQFSHIVENGLHSPYGDWFYINKFPVRPYGARAGKHGYHAWWGIPELPKLNVDHPAVREFLFNVAEHWIEFGIDGWRLDVPEEIKDPLFWRTFRERVRQKNDQAYLVGEIWHEAQDWLKGDMFDAVMNYQLTRYCLGFFIGDRINQQLLAKTSFKSIDPLDGTRFLAEVDRLDKLYAPEVSLAQMNLLGSHDLPRFKTLAKGDNSCYELALLFLTTYPGAPCIYYGDEIGLEGKRDPDCRAAFPRHASVWDSKLRSYVRNCLLLRKKFPPLQRGSFRPFQTTETTVSYTRHLDNECLLIILNVSSKATSFQMPENSVIPDRAILVPVFPDTSSETREYRQIDKKQDFSIDLEPRSGKVFKVISPRSP